MKRLLLVLLSVILLSGCGILDRGNYEKDRTGYVLSEDLIISYHTNSIGEIDVFQIDQIMSFFEALDYTNFDLGLLSENVLFNSFVNVVDLTSCGVESDSMIPKFIRTNEGTYYYNVRDNGYCTYDEYIFHEDGYTIETEYLVVETNPLENINITLYKDADFKINTFEVIIFIENIYYDELEDIWVKELISALPMSTKQAGNLYEDNSDFIEEITVFEQYVLDNQSINLLVLKENYTDEDVNNIWDETTIDVLGRDHEIIKKVRLINSQEIIDIINDTLSRLGMFQ
ncbi:MAG: hypothetical protein KQ78_00044 [Candidatus Izimaplasma bacterium HR2]|nr:MAG: hypothetical protein KQ78_00044 [Candidatus Izimaplasma bacterium HR2]